MSKFLTRTFFIGLSILVSQANAAIVSVDVSGQVTSSSITGLPVGEPISGRITYDQSVVPDVGTAKKGLIPDLNGTLILVLAGETFDHTDEPGTTFIGFSDGLVTGMDFAVQNFDAWGLTDIDLATTPVSGGITTDQFFIRDENDANLVEGMFIFSAPVLNAAIDIKPGSDPNGVNPRGGGVIPVAVLGSSSFDAMQVDVTTVEFGPAGATPVHDGHVEDVNGDGADDFVVHFKASATGISCGDTDATLTGDTSGSGDGPFEGTDAVKTAGCN